MSSESEGLYTVYTGMYRVWGFPKLGVPFMGRPIIRIVVFGGPYWGPLFWKLPHSLIIHGGKGQGQASMQGFSIL